MEESNETSPQMTSSSIDAHRWRNGDYSISVGPIFGEEGMQVLPQVNDTVLPPLEEPPQEVAPELSPGVKIYLARLQSQTGRRLAPHEFKAFLGPQDKKEINRIFFSLDAQPLESMEEKIAEITNQLKAQAKIAVARQVQKLKESEEKMRYQADEHFKSAEQYLVSMSNLRMEREALEGRSTDLAPIVRGALTNPFWKFKKVEGYGGAIVFTSGDVVMTHRDDVQGVDMSVNFGSFELWWEPGTSSISLKKNGNNLNLHGYYHPHVNGNGTPCWGNAAKTVTGALLVYDFAKVLLVAQSLLTTYNPDSPYVRLSDFFVASNPDLLKEGELVYERDHRAWVYEKALPDSVPEYDNTMSVEDDEGHDHEVYHVSIYYRVNKKYGIRIDDTMYIRANNNRYIAIGEEDIYEN